MGLASRVAFWEIPAIRAQAARLAEHLLNNIPA